MRADASSSRFPNDICILQADVAFIEKPLGIH